MISAGFTNFRFIDRGKKSTLVLIPGWAADCRIFAKLNLDFNYLLPLNLSISTFENDLIKALKKYYIKKISLFGWSLGGFLAADFCKKNYSLVDELFLVGVRQKYDSQEIEKIKEVLADKRKGYLYKFYSDCFYNKETFGYFKKNLIKDYLDQANSDYLLKGLNYLKEACIEPENLRKIRKVKIVHGEFDRIAPLQQAKEIKNQLSEADFVLVKNAGHIPFLGDNFNQYLK